MTTSNWNIAHASVRGTSHVEKGTECQDRFDYRLLDTAKGETLVVVLSDGAGSSQYSQIGAEHACSLFIREIEDKLSDIEGFDNLNKEFGRLWLDYFRQKIADYAEEEEKNTRDYACTFLAAVVWQEGAVFYQVGDGGIIYSTTGEAESYCFGIPPPVKEYANATDFITEKNAGKKLLYEFVREPIKDLVIFTDGIERIAINIQAEMPHEPFLIPMLTPLHAAVKDGITLNEKLAAFLDSPRINEKTDDDKTLFLASFCGAETEAVFDRKSEEINYSSLDSTEILEVKKMPDDENFDDRMKEQNIEIPEGNNSELKESAS